MVIAICYTEKIAKLCLCNAGFLQPLLDFTKTTKFQTIKLEKLIKLDIFGRFSKQPLIFSLSSFH